MGARRRSVSKVPTSTGAFSELRSEHQALDATLAAVATEATKRPSQAEKLLRRIGGELFGHMELEETLIYPLAEAAAVDESAVLRALSQHQVLKNLLDDLSSTDPRDRTFVPKAIVLLDTFRAHAEEEDRSVLVPLRENLTDAQRRALGLRVRERRTA